MSAGRPRRVEILAGGPSHVGRRSAVVFLAGVIPCARSIIRIGIVVAGPRPWLVRPFGSREEMDRGNVREIGMCTELLVGKERVQRVGWGRLVLNGVGFGPLHRRASLAHR